MKRIIYLFLLLPLFFVSPQPAGSDGTRFYTVSTLTQKACNFYKVPFANVFKIWLLEDWHLRGGKEWEKKVCEYAYGVPHILGSTARATGYKGRLDNLTQDEISIPLGVKHFKNLYLKSRGNMEKVCWQWNGSKHKYYKKYCEVKL